MNKVLLPSDLSHRWIHVLLVMLALIVSASPAWAKTQQRNAEQTVQDTTFQFFELMRSKRKILKEKPDHIIELVHEHIAPYIAFDDMARWVLARHWRDITEEEKQMFTETFRELMIRTYSRTLINYIDSTITLEGSAASQRPDFAIVGVRIDIPGQQKDTKIRYRMRLKKGEWKVLDITLNGISLLSNYRKTFDEFITRSGAGGLIADMRKKLATSSRPSP